jgi:hemoglobin-like flavoprotein
LGNAFTQPVKAAWTEAYTVLSSVMQKGADGLGHVARTMKVPSGETVDG